MNWVGKISQDWPIKVDDEQYGELVRERFDNKCPYCLCNLNETICIIEHLDGMNRCRAGLHLPGNVLVACKRCNNEKRRDDSLKTLLLANSGWGSFLSHDGMRCMPSCQTCAYWRDIWTNETERQVKLRGNLDRIRLFRAQFPQLESTLTSVKESLPALLAKLYSDCQAFAETEINSLLEKFEQLAQV